MRAPRHPVDVSRVRSWDACLPDGHACRRLQPEAIAVVERERVVELVDIADDLIAPQFGRRVGINRDPQRHIFASRAAAPGLGPGVEESLGAREAVDDLGGCAVQREQVRLPRDAQSTEVTDVLSDRERPVHLKVR